MKDIKVMLRALGVSLLLLTLAACGSDESSLADEGEICAGGVVCPAGTVCRDNACQYPIGANNSTPDLGDEDADEPDQSVEDMSEDVTTDTPVDDQGAGDTGGDTGEPDADEPDADEPDADAPDADVPDADEPDADEPDVVEDMDAPDAVDPDLGSPDADEPDVDEPDMDAPDVVEDLDMGADDGDEPDMDAPDVPEGDLDMGEDEPDMIFDPGGECDPFAQDCPLANNGEQQQCIPVGGELSCRLPPVTQVGEDETCQGPLDCEPGMTCINWSDGRGTLCTLMCDRNTGDGCGPDKACTSFLQSNEAIGLCAPRAQTCDIYAQDCPDAGDACTFGRDPDSNDPIFICDEAGTQGEGELCASSNGRCEAGLICIRGGDDMSRCHAVCDEEADCQVQGQRCTGRSNTWQVTYCR